MRPYILSLLSVFCGSVVGGNYKASSYQSQPGDDDPYPMRHYVGSKMPLNVQSNGPQAMVHTRDHNNLPGRAIPKQSHFEPLFDDFPGPKTKQRIYYPGKGYVEMQVPVQQPDPYSDGKPKNYQSGAYDSARYNTGGYDASKYNSGAYDASSDSGYDAPAPQRSYSPPAYHQAQPSYQAPAPQPTYSAPSPTDYKHEDDDSPFDYLAKQNSGRTSSSSAGGYQETSGSSYQPSPPAQTYRPSPPAYKPPPQSYHGYGSGGDGGEAAGHGYSGGDDDSSEVGLQSYNPPLPSNPSGYVPSGAYPSSYPDDKSASTFSQLVADNGYRSGPQNNGQGDGLASAFGARSLNEDGAHRRSSYDGHDHGFYDLAEKDAPGQGQYKK